MADYSFYTERVPFYTERVPLESPSSTRERLYNLKRNECYEYYTCRVLQLVLLSSYVLPPHTFPTSNPTSCLRAVLIQNVLYVLLYIYLYTPIASCTQEN